MGRQQSAIDQRASRGEQWVTTMVSLVVGAGFFALWFWLLPGWLGFRVDIAGESRWRWLRVEETREL
jgi:hypothetical protein